MTTRNKVKMFRHHTDVMQRILNGWWNICLSDIDRDEDSESCRVLIGLLQFVVELFGDEIVTTGARMLRMAERFGIDFVELLRNTINVVEPIHSELRMTGIGGVKYWLMVAEHHFLNVYGINVRVV
jgi:hypothetical protein